MGDLVKELEMEVIDPAKLRASSVGVIFNDKGGVRVLATGLQDKYRDSELHFWGDEPVLTGIVWAHSYEGVAFGATYEGRVIVNRIPELTRRQHVFSEQEGNDLAHYLYLHNNFNPFSQKPDFIRERIAEKTEEGKYVAKVGSVDDVVELPWLPVETTLLTREGNVLGFLYHDRHILTYKEALDKFQV